MNDPARMISEGLGTIPLLGVAKGSIGKFLGEITDGLTVAAGVGSLIASAFDIGGEEAPSPPKETAAAEVGGSFGV